MNLKKILITDLAKKYILNFINMKTHKLLYIFSP